MALYVYRSSAGSGKTTALVNAYLKITLRDPSQFRHILAITFTNKAAAEMKTRILDALEELIVGDPQKIRKYDPLFDELHYDEATMKQKAGQLQSLILHNYDEFAVSTIDAFVHRIIRTFATDVKLPQNFEVVIDREDFIPDIVDELFRKVGSDKALTDIMVNFVMSQTDEEKGYNIGYQVEKFVEKQIGEEGFQHLQKLDNLSTGDFATIIEKLNRKIAAISSAIRQEGQKAIELIAKNGLSQEAFYHTTSGIFGFFEKCSHLQRDDHLPPKAWPLASINDDKWTSGKASEDDRLKIDGIKEELKERFNRIDGLWPGYFRYKFIYQKIYALALTHEIRTVFLDYTGRTQKVHISEFNKRINQAIAGQPVPFIYERLGRKYNFFLIDEFQDTSMLQWQNLLPLIEESLATGNFNMLVGDAKQAIYRFRNGEVELFVNLPKLYGKEHSPYLKEKEQVLAMNYNEIPLDQNWRSEYRVIEFNNDFFEILKSKYDEHIQKIYAKHRQQIPEGKSKDRGFVSIELVETENSEAYAQQRLAKILEQVKKLIGHQYEPKDICVLTRTNSYAIEVASFLIENNYNVVSSESLLLSNSPAVRLIIAFYNLLLYPAEPVYLAEFISNLIRIEDDRDDFHTVYAEAIGAFSTGPDAVFERLKLNLNTDEVAELPVYEIAEYLVRQLQLNRNENIYLHYFLDFVFDAQENGKSEITDFMAFWQIKKSGAFITMPEVGNAIRIMTVHKAKGLKFEAVITDMINRSPRNAKDDYWTEMDDPDLEQLKVVMLPVKTDLEKIGMKAVYDEEKEKTDLDFLNLVYVACTRAVSALFLNGNLVQNGRSNDKFTELLTHFLQQKSLMDENRFTYEFGQLMQPERDEEAADQPGEVVLKKLVSSTWEDQVMVAGADDVYWEALDKKPARVYGNLVHAMLSKVRFLNDIDHVTRIYRQAGLLDEQEGEEIRKLLQAVVNHPELGQYFRKDAIIKNETEFIEKENENAVVLRPDRVVLDDGKLAIIDYKTGEKESGHVSQINQYAEAFEKAGYAEIVKKLVYLNDGVEVVNVD